MQDWREDQYNAAATFGAFRRGGGRGGSLDDQDADLEVVLVEVPGRSEQLVLGAVSVFTMPVTEDGTWSIPLGCKAPISIIQ